MAHSNLGLVSLIHVYVLGKCTSPQFFVLEYTDCIVKKRTTGNSEEGLNTTIFLGNTKKDNALTGGQKCMIT